MFLYISELLVYFKKKRELALDSMILSSLFHKKQKKSSHTRPSTHYLSTHSPLSLHSVTILNKLSLSLTLHSLSLSLP